MKFGSLACIFSVVIILFGGCKREPYEDTLPPVTNWGARTFGCKVNGINWALKPRQYGQYADRLSGGYNKGSFYVHAEKYDEDYPNSLCQWCAPGSSQSILIEINNYRITKPGYYEIPNYEKDSAIFHAVFYGEFYSDYYIPSSIKEMARLTITRFDTINQHYAGSFEFIAFEPTGKVPVLITAGRFDF